MLSDLKEGKTEESPDYAVSKYLFKVNNKDTRPTSMGKNRQLFRLFRPRDELKYGSLYKLNLRRFIEFYSS